MAKITTFDERNPDHLIKQIGERLRVLRLAAGWTQAKLAERSGVSLSTLKLLERTGKGSLQRMARIAVALNAEEELRGLFAESGSVLQGGEAARRAERKRAPRARHGRRE